MNRMTRALLCLALTVPMSLGASAALAQGPDPILDQELTLTAIAGTPVASDVGITARFAADGTLTGFGGCNEYNSTWNTDFSTLTLTGDIASTRKTCGDTVDALETQYLGLLQTAVSWSLDGTSLQVMSADGSVLSYGGGSGPSASSPAPTGAVTPVASPGGSPAAASDIVGSRKATQMMGTTLPAGFLKITLDIAADGSLTGNAGCNDYSASWTLSGSTFTLTDVSTKSGATCDPTTQSLEQSYFSVIPYLDTAKVVDGNLVLGSSLSSSISFTFAPAS